MGGTPKSSILIAFFPINHLKLKNAFCCKMLQAKLGAGIGAVQFRVFRVTNKTTCTSHAEEKNILCSSIISSPYKKFWDPWKHRSCFPKPT